MHGRKVGPQLHRREATNGMKNNISLGPNEVSSGLIKCQLVSWKQVFADVSEEFIMGHDLPEQWEKESDPDPQKATRISTQPVPRNHCA